MLQEKFVRFQLGLFKPFTSTCSLETTREGQDKLGQLLTSIYKSRVTLTDCDPGGFPATLISPKDELSGGIVLYLHGGGYTCGDIQYARGFGTTLAAKCGIHVFCAAYRLAPENPFPAAVDDALCAYRHVLTMGYKPSDIVLCGESAGGGLIFSLCMKLRELDYEMPAGIIAISPWTDLTLSGKSFDTNCDADPSLTKERLKFYADCYVHGTPVGIDDKDEDNRLKARPLVSPMFGDLCGMPPTLIFVGGDEILLDDSLLMHEALRKAGCDSEIIVRDGMWHGYVLYCLKENECDFDTISVFLKKTVSKQKKLRWMRLDNAAKIYPAIKTRQWNNYFRLSMTLTEDVDKGILQSALDVTVRRFPSIAVRLKRGAFWYYLEEIPNAPGISDEGTYPLVRTPFDNVRKCAFRVILYEKRIAVEFFHAITDGNGGMVFLKTLVAEYLTERYGITIPNEDGVLDRLRLPLDAELEDSFLRCSGSVNASRSERDAFHITGTPEPDGFCNNTAFIMSASAVAVTAKKYGVTVTAFLTAALLLATIRLQEDTVSNPRRRRDVRILLPVNLRKMFSSTTLRNFVLFIICGVDVRLGEYSFEELCSIVRHQMGLELTEKEMRKRISVNVNTEKTTILKIAPLFLKNLVMKLAFRMVSARKSCYSLSNLGVIRIPEIMRKYVDRVDFVLGVQAHAPYNLGVLSYGDTLTVNIIRNIREPLLERRFYDVLRQLGVHVKLESNQRD